MSLYPCFSEFELILKSIYNYSQGIYEDDYSINNNSIISEEDLENIGKENSRKKIKGVKIPLDKIIENLLLEIPIPPRGVYKISYNLIDDIKPIEQSEMNKLPVIDVNLKKIFSILDINQVKDIYHKLLLETKILFFSNDIEIINIFVYGFLALLYPFNYQYQVVTIMPKNNLPVLECMTPYIFGINETYSENFFNKNNLSINEMALIVDIDNQKLHSLNLENDFPDLPKKPKNFLIDKLTLQISKTLSNNSAKSLLKKRSTTVKIRKKEYYPNLNGIIPQTIYTT